MIKSIQLTILGITGTIATINIVRIIKPMIKVEYTKYLIRKLIYKKGLTFDEAKKEIIDNKIMGEIIKELNVDKANFNAGDKTVNQLDTIKFLTDEYGYLRGKFLGLKRSEIEGYTYHIFLKEDTKESIMSFPIEIIDMSTVEVV